MIRAGILTASDTRSDGSAVDGATGPLRELLEQSQFEVASCLLVPDDVDRITQGILMLATVEHVDLVLTTGGTGLGPRDVTPEATLAAIDREVPGIGELLRIASARTTPHAWLSRGIAGTCGTTLVVNLPGSPSGAVECARLVLPLVAHAAAVMHGTDRGHAVTKNDDRGPS